MLFRSRREPDPPAQKLGFRSPLVLAKLDYHLCEQYSDVLDAPLPEQIERSIEQLTREDGPEVLDLPELTPRDSGEV